MLASLRTNTQSLRGVGFHTLYTSVFLESYSSRPTTDGAVLHQRPFSRNQRAVIHDDDLERRPRLIVVREPGYGETRTLSAEPHTFHPDTVLKLVRFVLVPPPPLGKNIVVY